MSLKDLPEDCRPRDKLLLKGAEALSDAELLAIFLRIGIPGTNAIDLARNLLKDFGSLRALLTADAKKLTEHKGIGQAKYVQLQAVLELSRRFFAEEMQRKNSFTSTKETCEYLRTKLRDKSRETFLVLFLDNQHQLIKEETLFTGTVNAAAVYPREILKRALDLNANAIILAHNHPSGVPEPSQADRQITARIMDALSLVDIRLLDHIIIGDKLVVSFAERGLI